MPRGQPRGEGRVFRGTDSGYRNVVPLPSFLPLARRERDALCETALQVGAAAPTLCDGWDARDLLAHLVVREHTLLGAAGIPVPLLARFTERDMARAARTPYPALVERVREVGWTPYRIPLVDKLANTLEYLVHHEDLLRARPTWEPRTFDAADLDLVWSQLKLPATMALRGLGVPLQLKRSDTGEVITVRQGPDPVVVSGPVVELVELAFGRKQLREVEYDGPPATVAKVRG
jgi:uncharacterized protein (TIGR03085 family)